MNADRAQTDRRLARAWIKASTLGWILGFVLVIAISLLFDALGASAQFMVGVGMGAGVGFMQARVLHQWLGSSAPWTATSAFGLGLPFILGDLLDVAGVEHLYSLPIYVLMGGLIAGVLQAKLLRSHASGVSRWIPACVVAWGVPAGIVLLNDAQLLPPVVSGLLFLALILFGGVVVGAVTGPVLARVLGAQPT